MCRRVCGSKAKTRPSREHIGGVQRSKPLENSNWISNFPSTRFSTASSHALNSPNVEYVATFKNHPSIFYFI